MKSSWFIGKPEMGKTTALNRLALNDIHSGKSIFYFGEDAPLLLNYISQNHRSRTILLDPSDTEYPFGFNPLLDADSFLSTVKSLWHTDIATPNIDLYITATIRALSADPTILNIPRLLNSEEYRIKIVPTIRNKTLREFWEDYETIPSKERRAEIKSTLNKVYAFLTDDVIRNIIGQRTKLDLSDLSDKAVIVPLKRRPLSPEKLSLIGSLILSAIHNSGYTGTYYIDNVHRFAPHLIKDMLDAKPTMHVTNHYLKQLDPELMHALIGLVGTVYAFRLGVADADFLRKQFAIRDGENTLDDPLELLRPYIAHVVTPRGVKPSQVMPEITRSPKPGSAAKIIANSRMRYATPRSVVEAQLNA